MVKIYAPLTRDDRFHCSSGSDVKPVFKLVGNHLVKQSEIIISEYINSFRDECLIENIIRRFNNGDLSALNRVQGAYIDSTQLPKDIHTANKMLNYAQTIYNSLGSDLKKITLILVHLSIRLLTLKVLINLFLDLVQLIKDLILLIKSIPEVM